MTEDPDNLTLRFLRRLDEKMDRILDELRDLKGRMTSLETEVAQMHVSIAGNSARMDRIETRLDRIEKRLDLVTT